MPVLNITLVLGWDNIKIFAIICTYHIRGLFGGDLNLMVWQI